jgi:hypothetical protein
MAVARLTACLERFSRVISAAMNTAAVTAVTPTATVSRAAMALANVSYKTAPIRTQGQERLQVQVLLQAQVLLQVKARARMPTQAQEQHKARAADQAAPHRQGTRVELHPVARRAVPQAAGKRKRLLFLL